jgi:hypothetical protein
MVHHEAKSMILGNIFYYQLRRHLSLEHSNRSYKEIRRQFRLKVNLFKNYIKTDIFNLKFKQFMMGFLIKPI